MIIFDTESDGLLHEKVSYNWDTHERTVEPPATKFHVFGWTTDGETIHATPDENLFLDAISKSEKAGCHNSIRHDFPLIEKLLGYTYEGIKVDTLALSWDLSPKRNSHGLEAWGDDLGVKKVKVENHEWKEGDLELMLNRVKEDVKINWLLWKKQEKILKELYND